MATTPVIAAIQRAAAAKGIDWRPLAAVAHYESGLNPRALGDGGHAFGLFQNNNAGGTITGDPNPTRFFDPNVAATYAANAVSKLGLAGMSPAAQVAAIVNRYERPAKPLPEIAGAQSFLKTLGIGNLPTPPATPVTDVVSPRQTAAVPAAPSVATPSSPTTGPDLSFLQAGLAQAQGAQQRAFDALAKVSGGPARAAAPALDLSSIFTPPAQAPPVATVPLHGAAPVLTKMLSPQAAKAVKLARQFVDTPYLHGGMHPNGFTTAGLISYIWSKNGVALPPDEAAQARAGVAVNAAHLEPGDSIYLRDGSQGMFVGAGQYLTAATHGNHAQIMQLTPAVRADIVNARRYGGDAPPTQAPAAATPTSFSGNGQKNPTGTRTATFDGTTIAAWMLPALQYARANGWKGTLTSGVRSYAEQAQLYKRYQAGGNIAARPGQSNHEIGNGGAFDATDPETLNRILARYPGQYRPIWAMTVGLADHPHFSLTGR